MPPVLAVTRAVAVATALLAVAPAAAQAAGRAAKPGRAREAAAPPTRRDPGVGLIVYTTRSRAYADVGAEEGLAANAELRLLRAGRPAGTCRVEAVAAHHAVCRCDDARVGDTFALARPLPPPAPKPQPPLVSPAELDRRAGIVAAAPYPKVEAVKKGAGVRPVAPRSREVVISHASWSSSGHSAWQQERADLVVRGAELLPWLRLHADLRALRWTARPGATRVPVEQTQLLVWGAELVAREPDRPLAVALGRLQPWGIPGATVIDGAQIGLRLAGRTEIGIFGGTVPELGTLSPTLDRATAGAYGTFELAGKGFLARQDVRAAFVTSPEAGRRFEGELRSSALLLRSVNVTGDLRVGVGGTDGAPAGIDGAYVDLSGRPLRRLLLSGSFRYWGLRLPDASSVGFFAGAERRADVAAGWDLGALVVSVTGGRAQDLATGLERRFAGPEVSFPRLLGARGRLTLGFLEERGWIAGRTAFAQAVLRPLARMRLTTRLYWAADARAAGADDHEVGAFAAVSADLASRLSVRATVLARTGARGVEGASRSTGLDATVGLAGGF